MGEGGSCGFSLQTRKQTGSQSKRETGVSKLRCMYCRRNGMSKDSLKLFGVIYSNDDNENIKLSSQLDCVLLSARPLPWRDHYFHQNLPISTLLNTIQNGVPFCPPSPPQLQPLHQGHRRHGFPPDASRPRARPRGGRSLVQPPVHRVLLPIAGQKRHDITGSHRVPGAQPQSRDTPVMVHTYSLWNLYLGPSPIWVKGNKGGLVFVWFTQIMVSEEVSDTVS